MKTIKEYRDTDRESEYHTDEVLRKIAQWEPDDFQNLIEFIRPLWAYNGFKTRWTKSAIGQWVWRIELKTAGLSGNEDLLRALLTSFHFSEIWYTEWKRGGYHVFEINPRNCDFKLVSDYCKDNDTYKQYIYKYPSHYRWIHISDKVKFIKPTSTTGRPE